MNAFPLLDLDHITVYNSNFEIKTELKKEVLTIKSMTI